MGTRQTYDSETVITVTSKAEDTDHLRRVFPRGTESQRFRIYEIIVTSKTVGETYKRVRQEGLYCSDWDFDNA